MMMSFEPLQVQEAVDAGQVTNWWEEVNSVLQFSHFFFLHNFNIICCYSHIKHVAK